MLSAKPRVVLADDHELVAAGIASLLAPDFELLATVGDGEALVEAVERLRPDVSLVDITMPRLNGLDAARRVLTASPETRVLFLTMHADRAYLDAARAMGAHGFVLKQSAARELSIAIRQALEGGFYAPPGLNAATAPARLTPRQREVLQCVAQGLSAKQIAGRLGVSEKTVEFHKRALMDTLGIRTTAELTRYALANGLA